MKKLLEIESIKNVTLNSTLLNKDQAKKIEISEICEDSIAINAPMKAAAGMLISIEGEIIIDKQRTHFSAIGKIESAVATSENANTFHVKLRQYDKSLWGKVLKQLSEKQSHADGIFNRIRCEDN